MKFLKERIQVICDQLEKHKIIQRIELDGWSYKKGEFRNPTAVESSETEWESFDSRADHWYGPDGWYWFRTSFEVPENFDKRPLWLNVKTQIEEWDDGKNPQFLLFINGEIIQGLDMNHREVMLSSKAKAGERLQIDLQAYTGTLHSEFRLIADIVEINPEAEGLYYDLQVPLWAFSRMAEDDKNRLDITTVLNETINLVDFRHPPSPEFLESLKAARGYIKKYLYEDMGGYSDVVATCIGHTHIDVAWWWTVEQTRTKVARSFATVLKLMEEYPDYRFMSSQPVLYAFVKERYPELYEKIKARVAEGRWEVEGGMWVEADCNLTSGESLIRQFLYGKRFFKEEFGVDNRLLWLPDVFGYSGALPQIMRGCGIDYFMTTKLSWNQYNKIPADTLIWEGIDGSEVFAHFISTLGVGQSSENFFTTYNGMLHPDAIMGGWERYQNKDINNDILVAFGHGDGGGGPTRAMLETAERMDYGVRGIPKTRQEPALKYFEELEGRVRDNRRLPRWVGEFYFEYHRGTYTSMARNKRSNRKIELLLMDLEFISILEEKLSRKLGYPREQLDEMWKILLLNQFHDILPGTSIFEVYEQTKKEYLSIKETGERLLNERISAMRSGECVSIYNTLGFERSDVVSIELELLKGFNGLRDSEENVYPVQLSETSGRAYIKGLPSKGYSGFEPVAVERESVFEIGDKFIATPYYAVRFDDKGRICALYDRANEREVLKAGGFANRLVVYEDKPIYYDNWDIDEFYTEKSWAADNLTRFEWTENGSVYATLELEWEYQKSVIKQRVIFYADTPRIDFESWVDWKENQQLLKTHFDLDLHTDEATFDIQFGNVVRKTHKNTSWEQARFESCAHQWMDVSEGGYGVSLINDCKFGHSVSGGNIALTLIKSGIEPNPVSDQEEHVFKYAIYPHRGTWKDAEIPRVAAGFNQPALAVKSSLNEMYSFMSVDRRNIMLQTVKRAEDGKGVVARLYEFENERGSAELTCAAPIKKAYECNMLEEFGSDCDEILRVSDKKIKLNFRPFEIKTVYLDLE